MAKDSSQMAREYIDGALKTRASLGRSAKPSKAAYERAVRMALAVRERVGRMAQDWAKRGYDLSLGIGIAQGFATIGAIGFEGRWD